MPRPYPATRSVVFHSRSSFEQERRSHVPTKAARPKGEGQDGPSLPRPHPATPRVAHHHGAIATFDASPKATRATVQPTA